ncbi:M23 family metallopeptidase [Xanthomonas prunicola]|jgi:murein DD-endopeptidase MepM/ murein hydrolase activator NlpD|uniref:M23 family metallopeptidase n=1 Tax=Xanthomonas prunicola TaxID=2053930 RepID=UPI0021B187AC|nr:M23 family metallopeptidase [Xanthomonas prunicola]UXA47837.1 M23 family metallopeptidase [Xanthomonas prunicola]UXA56302.1 M23 family metallopeptidase [Xanthomonas prunicola]
MKLLMILVAGVAIGAGGYWWLERTAPEAKVEQPSSTSAMAADSNAAGAARMAAPAPAPAATPPVAAAPATDAAPTNTPVASTPAPTADGAAPGSALLIPVQGIGANQLQDTFTDARSEGRVHDAIDILAPTGTPVVAVADGTVEKLFTSDRGGLTVYQFEPGGTYCYYYAHLQRYADGLAEKQSIKRGQVIGYVGSTGNADPAAPHLHFEIHRLGPEKQWWKGEALNPYPILHGDQPLQ